MSEWKHVSGECLLHVQCDAGESDDRMSGIYDVYDDELCLLGRIFDECLW